MKTAYEKSQHCNSCVAFHAHVVTSSCGYELKRADAVTVLGFLIDSYVNCWYYEVWGDWGAVSNCVSQFSVGPHRHVIRECLLQLWQTQSTEGVATDCVGDLRFKKQHLKPTQITSQQGSNSLFSSFRQWRWSVTIIMCTDLYTEVQRWGFIDYGPCLCHRAFLEYGVRMFSMCLHRIPMVCSGFPNFQKHCSVGP